MWKLLLFVMLSVGVQGDPFKIKNFKTLDYFDIDAARFCTDNTTEYNIDDVKAATRTFKECMNGLLDLEVIKTEIGEAMRTKAFEGVIKKYCAKAPQVKACILDVITGLTPCLPTDLPAKKVYSDVIDFACYNEGARLTSFLKEDGPKCFEEKDKDINKCAEIDNSSEGDIMQQMCTVGRQFTACAVAALKTCSNPTPGSLADELRQVYFSSFNCTEVHQPTFNRLG